MLIPDSMHVSQSTYELPPLNVQGIASDLVLVLMLVGTTCLVVAVYGACSTRQSKKWDSVYDGECVGREDASSSFAAIAVAGSTSDCSRPPIIREESFDGAYRVRP